MGVLDVIKANKGKVPKMEPPIYGMNDKMPFGKFKGFSMKSYIACNPHSLQWFVENGVIKVKEDVWLSMDKAISDATITAMFGGIKEYGDF